MTSVPLAGGTGELGARGGIDPIRFEVIRNALTEIAEEMAASLRRSAYSTNIKTRADFSCAFFDAKMRAIAQSFAQPSHLGSLVRLVPAAVADYGPERMGPGDAILVNHPYIGGGHLNDVTLIAPFTYEGEVLGYVACLAHHVDVGGGAPASVGAFQEVFQEGVIIPPVKLVENGVIVTDIYRLILEQIRSKRETAGDLRAQIACNNTGVRRLSGLVDQMGARAFEDYLDELVAYTSRRTLAAIARLPRGSFAATGLVDTDGFSDEPVRLSARFTVEDDGVLFDLTGCDEQRRAPVNSTYAQTYSNCAYVLKSLIDPDIPVNDGFYRHVRVLAPPGTVVNATHPAPVVGGWETAMRVVETLYVAVSQALPERVPAGSKGMICHVGFGGRNPRDGELFAFLETVAGGIRRSRLVRWARRRPAPSAEHRERARRGDRDQLPGQDPALRADRGIRGAGNLPRRPWAAQGLHLRGRRVVHDPRRPRQVGPIRTVRWRIGGPGAVHPGPRRRRDTGQLEDHALPPRRRRREHPVVRWRRIRAAGPAGSGGRPARRARRPDLGRPGRGPLPRRGGRRGGIGGPRPDQRRSATARSRSRWPTGWGWTSVARSPTRS